MRKLSRSRFVVADVVVVSVVAIATLVLVALNSSSHSGVAARTVILTIGGPTAARPLPPGFVGLSLELPAVEPYAGGNPLAIDPVFLQLVRNLNWGQSPVIRIGGDSADWSWWPVSGIARPPGVTYELNDRWFRVTRALTQALGARLILGLNFEADNPALAAAEARAMSDGIGSGSIQAYELGNEPELYGTFAWYHTAAGQGVPGRPSNYGFNSFLNDFTRVEGALPGLTLAGPTTGGPGWTPNLGQFLGAAPQVRLVALHRYPTQVCFVSPSSPHYPTIGHLLSGQASTGLANGFQPSIQLAHARGLPIRIDELNTVSCGADPQVSRTFASALWALDALFEIARVGADGVNIHTFPGAGYELFRITHASGRWLASVAPEYYGLLMFARAAPPGSRLLHISGLSGDGLKVWATRAGDGKVRVVLINKGGPTRVVSLRTPGPAGVAALMRLTAPSVKASTGVMLGGQNFGAVTNTGLLAGQAGAGRERLEPQSGRYIVALPSASAALLTLTR
jgi:hypothetical protein